VIITLGCNIKQWMLNKNVKLDEMEKKLIWHWLHFWIFCWKVGLWGVIYFDFWCI
jgi:hypothetical protein